MRNLRSAILLGILVWLVPFIVACCVFPFKQSWRSLFESIMPVVVAAIVVWCSIRYHRHTGMTTIREGFVLGCIWLGISIAIDLPLMLSPPINLPLIEYLADIGLTYVMIPIITTGIATVAQHGVPGNK